MCVSEPKYWYGTDFLRTDCWYMNTQNIALLFSVSFYTIVLSHSACAVRIRVYLIREMTSVEITNDLRAHRVTCMPLLFVHIYLVDWANRTLSFFWKLISLFRLIISVNQYSLFCLPFLKNDHFRALCIASPFSCRSFSTFPVCVASFVSIWELWLLIACPLNGVRLWNTFYYQHSSNRTLKEMRNVVSNRSVGDRLVKTRAYNRIQLKTWAPIWTNDFILCYSLFSWVVTTNQINSV